MTRKRQWREAAKRKREPEPQEDGNIRLYTEGV